jgi:hypothetical protein
MNAPLSDKHDARFAGGAADDLSRDSMILISGDTARTSAPRIIVAAIVRPRVMPSRLIPPRAMSASDASLEKGRLHE